MVNPEQTWNDADTLLRIERERYPFERSLATIIYAVYQQHISAGSRILEVGAGQGYLKTLTPEEYLDHYFSSDLWFGNIGTGKQHRLDLQGLVATAENLPFLDGSLDCIVNMDAFDTLPDLPRALREVQRVLRPGGTFIHFQVNLPDHRQIWNDYPNLVFLPMRTDTPNQMMTAVARDALLFSAYLIRNENQRQLFLQMMDNKFISAVMDTDPQYASLRDTILELVDAMTIDALVIPSPHDYFKSKLERATMFTGMNIAQSDFRSVSSILRRSESQRQYPLSNVFALEQGRVRITTNEALRQQRPTQVV